MSFEINRFTPSQSDEWNEFVAHSKNGTFLLDRRYMDYHADRFADCSLMVRGRGKLLAVLPANLSGTTLCSHQGLTYGGLIMNHKLKTVDVCHIFHSLNEYLKATGVGKITYKPVPWIYCSAPSEEDLFALFHVCGARIVGRQAASVLTTCRARFDESRRSGIRKADRCGIIVRQTEDIDTFWPVLTENLKTKYNSRPVHTIEEMRLLMSRFPENIKLYMAYLEEKPIAGSVIYETPRVAHTQYIAASSAGHAIGALDKLFQYLLDEVYPAKPCFDFGTSLAGNGQFNSRLAFQKEGFGARTVCYDCYEWRM